MEGTGRALRGVCAALLPPEAGGPPPEALARLVSAYLQRLPSPQRGALLGAALAVDALALARHGRRLAALGEADRTAVVGTFAAAALTAPVAQALKSVVLLAHGTETFADPLVERAARTPLAAQEPPLDVTPAGAWPSQRRADAVVVGSGAGGAMAARTLARAGMEVVVVEEGRHHPVTEYRRQHPLRRFADMYRDGGATATIGWPPVLLPMGRAVGGSTLVNSGTCYRPPEAVVRRWRDEHGLALADTTLSARLDDVEATLGVSPAPLDVLGANGRALLRGAERLDWQAGPLRRNAPGCGGSCQCSIGCPRAAKAGVHLNALPQACAAGARIVAEARVERVLVVRGRAAGVLARRPDGSRFTISAPVVVVAAGATESPPLLARSGLGRHPRAGRNLALHPGVGVAGRFDEPIVPWEGVLQSVGVEELHAREGILIEATATPPGMGSTTLPGVGRRLLGELARADHLATVGAMVADRPGGRVVGAGGRTLLRYRLDRLDGARLLRAISAMGRLLFAAGAREVLPGLPGDGPVGSQAALDEALTGADPGRLKLAAFHPTGTLAAGADPQRHPVDPGGGLRGVDGVYVADASLLPTCPQVNPQVTIMALALGVADRVVADRGGRR